MVFFASFVYPVAPADGTGVPLREAFSVSSLSGLGIHYFYFNVKGFDRFSGVHYY